MLWRGAHQQGGGPHAGCGKGLCSKQPQCIGAANGVKEVDMLNICNFGCYGEEHGVGGDDGVGDGNLYWKLWKLWYEEVDEDVV